VGLEVQKRQGIFLILTVIYLVVLIGFTGCLDSMDRFALDTESVNIALDEQDNLHIVWSESINDEFCIFYTKLNDKGRTLINDKKLYSEIITPRHRPREDPDICIDSKGNVFIVFEINDSLYLTKLSNDGQNIVHPKRMNEMDNFSTDVSIAVDSEDNLHIVWMNWRNGPVTIFYTKLNGLGEELIPERELSKNDSSDPSISIDSHDPSICIDSYDNLYICWYSILRDDPFFRYGVTEISLLKMNKDGLQSYLNNYRIRNTGDHCSIEIEKNEMNQIVVVWTIDYQLKYLPLDMFPVNALPPNSTEEINMELGYNLSSNTVFEPAVCIDVNGEVNIVYYNSTSYEGEIYYLKSNYYGIVLEEKQITDAKDKSYDPAIDVDNEGNIYTVWVDERQNEYAIYFTKLDANYDKILEDKRISDDRNGKESDSLLNIVIESNIHIIYLFLAFGIIGIIAVGFRLLIVKRQKKK